MFNAPCLQRLLQKSMNYHLNYGWILVPVESVTLRMTTFLRLSLSSQCICVNLPSLSSPRPTSCYSSRTVNKMPSLYSHATCALLPGVWSQSLSLQKEIGYYSLDFIDVVHLFGICHPSRPWRPRSLHFSATIFRKLWKLDMWLNYCFSPNLYQHMQLQSLKIWCSSF